MSKMQKKRPFDKIRKIILANLGKGRKTVNQISTETGVNWKTVDNHLIYLIGKGFAHLVLDTKYVKIVEITEKGKMELKKHKIKTRRRKKK